jgi:hypothetical protein
MPSYNFGTISFSALKYMRFYWSFLLEARVGIEPTHEGFADLSLTTWVPRLDHLV